MISCGDAERRANIDAQIRIPQHVDLGAYHRFSNGWSATLDAVWVEFSRFGLTEVTVDGQNLIPADGNFNDFWIVSAGFGFLISPKIEARIGALYLQQPVDDDDRTFSFALDEVYGIGAGVQYTLDNGRSYDLNLSVARSPPPCRQAPRPC
jgi:long-chain fatty acid transport protein